MRIHQKYVEKYSRLAPGADSPLEKYWSDLDLLPPNTTIIDRFTFYYKTAGLETYYIA